MVVNHSKYIFLSKNFLYQGRIRGFLNICLRSYNKKCHIEILAQKNRVPLVKLSDPQINRSSGLFFKSAALTDTPLHFWLYLIS